MDIILIAVFSVRLAGAARKKGLRASRRVFTFVLAYLSTVVIATNMIVFSLTLRGVPLTDPLSPAFLLSAMLAACIGALIASITYRHQMRIIRDAPDPDAPTDDPSGEAS